MIAWLADLGLTDKVLNGFVILGTPFGLSRRICYWYFRNTTLAFGLFGYISANSVRIVYPRSVREEAETCPVFVISMFWLTNFCARNKTKNIYLKNKPLHYLRSASVSFRQLLMIAKCNITDFSHFGRGYTRIYMCLTGFNIRMYMSKTIIHVYVQL